MRASLFFGETKCQKYMNKQLDLQHLHRREEKMRKLIELLQGDNCAWVVAVLALAILTAQYGYLTIKAVNANESLEKAKNGELLTKEKTEEALLSNQEKAIFCVATVVSSLLLFLGVLGLWGHIFLKLPKWWFELSVLGLLFSSLAHAYKIILMIISLPEPF